MLKIVPSILTNDPDEAKQLIKRCEGVVDRVSIDIIDGKFVNNKTIDPLVLMDLETNIKIDFQLMVVEPINWVEKCVRAGADRIIGHVEKMASQIEFLEKVTSLGISTGLALDLPTSVSTLDPSITSDLDVVLVMSVRAGFKGQEFDPSVLPKIVELDKIRSKDNNPFKIHVDGGVTVGVVNDIKKAGADEASVGLRIFEGDLKSNIETFSMGV